MKYHNSRNFDDNTYDDHDVPSKMPFVSPQPADPVTGKRMDGDMAFATGPLKVHPDGHTTVRETRQGGNNVSGQADPLTP